MAFDALFAKYDRLVLLDTETTGLNYSRDEIIEFSLKNNLTIKTDFDKFQVHCIL